MFCWRQRSHFLPVGRTTERGNGTWRWPFHGGATLRCGAACHCIAIAILVSQAVRCSPYPRGKRKSEPCDLHAASMASKSVLPGGFALVGIQLLRASH